MTAFSPYSELHPCMRGNTRVTYIEIPELSATQRRRFEAKIERMPSGCWEWRGANKNGRGTVGFNGRWFIAPRVAWRLAHNRSPDAHVCHSCDNPACVNPAHLWLGTQQDNIDDMRMKGKIPGHRKPTHCRRGHPFDAENTRVSRIGKRCCRTCVRLRETRIRREHAAIL